MPSADEAIESIAKDVANLVRGCRVVGLGSGSTAAKVVRALANLHERNEIEFVPTSLQIKTEAERIGLRIADENRIPDIDLVFDGADQIDAEFNMIKGGGGALLREKILISSAKRVAIVADESKFASKLTRSVPVEVHPMARTSVAASLTALKGRPVLRTIEKGYPFVTENGNFILDTDFGTVADPRQKEIELKCIPGVMEVGIFTRKAEILYKARGNGTFEKISTQR